MDEKRAIERATAEAFLAHYNREHGTAFCIVQHGDAPDIVAGGDNGRRIQLEIVLTEDRAGDIQAALGRSDARSVDAFPLKLGSSLADNVADSLIERLHGKMMKRYGANTALVIRDTSGVGWDWDLVSDELKTKLSHLENPFDQGIWIVNRSKDRVFQIL